MATDATGTPTPLGIPTYNVNVDAPSGNGFNAAMAVIDTLIQARAPLASPAFTGTPTAPTPVSTDNTTKIATTAFVKAQGYLTSNAVTTVFGRSGAVVAASGDYSVSQVTGAAPLASPAFTGTPTAPTPATADNSTNVATTAFVKAQGYLTSSTGVTSFNGRSGAVVPQTGDYTAAQVTNAADKSSGLLQSFNANISSAGWMLANTYYSSAQSVSGATSVTLSPDYSLGPFAAATVITSGGTITINSPTNPPNSTQSGLLTIEVVNNSAGSTALSWGAKYVFTSTPATVAAGSRNLFFFIWDPLSVAWYNVGRF